jgi:hypothetical protein
MVWQKGRNWWEVPQPPLINLRYRKGCGFSHNSIKAYSNVICFFCYKKEFFVFWFVLIFNSEMSFLLSLVSFSTYGTCGAFKWVLQITTFILRKKIKPILVWNWIMFHLVFNFHMPQYQELRYINIIPWTKGSFH